MNYAADVILRSNPIATVGLRTNPVARVVASTRQITPVIGGYITFSGEFIFTFAGEAVLPL